MMKRLLLTVTVGWVLAQGAVANSYYADFKPIPTFKQAPSTQTPIKTHSARQQKNIPLKTTPKQADVVKPEPWRNDLRTKFLNNETNIMAINIRSFYAFDSNNNEIVETELGEKTGTFISAILGLDELQKTGVNTIHLLPITPVGKHKALGTAGSLYAITAFDEINPQLIEQDSNLSAKDQVRLFVNECHKRNIRVMVDLPSCGAYDMYMSNPNLFEKDSSNQPVIPADWTDVRLFKVKNANGKLNEELYNLHKDFVDMAFEVGFDGIRADVATIKPYEFWQRLISYTRAKDPQFLFLAEASDSWTSAPAKQAVFTPFDKLLEAGFDGYYGSYFKFKDITSASDFANIVNFNINLSKKYANKKATIGSFMTHDEQNPIFTGGEAYATQLIWLNALLPVNSYIVDGIATGDNYLYSYANRASKYSLTDDKTYYVHSGKFDIFNFSRTPGGKKINLLHEYVNANTFKQSALQLINSSDFKTLKTNNGNVFAYSRSNGKDSLIIILNKNIHSAESAKIKIKKLNEKTTVVPIKISTIPESKKGCFNTALDPAEIQILYLPSFEI